MPSLDALRSAAAEQAAALSSDFIGTEHLFLAWLTHARGPIADAMSAAGLTADSFRQVLAKGGKRGRGRRGPSTGEAGGLTSHAQKVVDLAIVRAREAGREEPSADDLVLAMVQDPRGAIARALTEFDIKPSRLKGLASDRPTPRRGAGAERAEPEAAPPPPPPPPTPRREERERGERPGRERRERPERTERPRREAPAAPPPPLPDQDSAPLRRDPPPLDVESVRRLPWLAPLYLAAAAAVALYATRGDPLWIFVTAALGIVPFAALMGQATEQLAERCRPFWGALLHAVAGNAALAIVAIVALRAGLVDIVKLMLVGSVLASLLLVLGLGLVAGGSRRAVQRFDRADVGMSSAMLALAVAALAMPTMVHLTEPAAVGLLRPSFSTGAAAVLLATFLLSLVFVLRTGRPLFGGGQIEHHELSGTWTASRAVGLLLVAVAGVGGLSVLLVQALPSVRDGLGVSPTFLGLIVLPVIGHAAQRGGAVTAARRGHADLAFQSVLGSSTQVALLVAPILVFVGAAWGLPGMNLVFSPFEVLALATAVIVSTIITLDRESHWFEGVQLLALHALIGAAAWFI